MVALFVLPFSAYSQTEAELKEKADALFNDEAYIEATPIYLRLLSLQPRDYNYNYKYGTCLLYNSDRKQVAFKYLNYAAKGPDVDKEVFYFLGKAYHLSYQFDKAIQYFNKYKELAAGRTLAKLNVDRQIEMCNNGKKLMNNLSNLVVMSKQQIENANFFRLYDLSNIGGTIIVTQEFQSKIDKKNKQVPLIHFPANPKMIFYSSYGETEENGLDIFVRKKLPDGKWSLPQVIKGDINTKYDENYPYMQPGGEYLYFSSKGHNSMGGYDVFKARYNPETDAFENVTNLDFAISSPDDELFYVVDSLDRKAYFASARESQAGKINVYNVRVERFPEQLVIFKGDVISKINPDQKVANIEVYDLLTDQRIGKYTSGKKDGGFLITVPKGGKYNYVVQMEGSPESHTVLVEAPFLDELKPIKQRITAYLENGEEKIKIENLLGEGFDDAQAIIAEVLINKSQLEPNSNLFNLDSLDNLQKQKELLDKIGLSNYGVADLSKIAQNDLSEINQSIADKKDALQKLTQITSDAIQDAQRSNQKADELIAKANETSDVSDAKNLINQSIQAKENAVNQTLKAQVAQQMQDEISKSAADDKQRKEQAQKVADLFKNVTEDNLQQKINSTDDAAKKYLADNFNKTKEENYLTVNESVDEIKERDALNSEVSRLNQAIDERNVKIKQLESNKINANKKEVGELETKISQLQDENRTDQELLNKTKKDREILGKKDAENQVKRVIIAEIKQKSGPATTTDLATTEDKNKTALTQLLASNTSNSLANIQAKADNIITAKEKTTATQNTANNTTNQTDKTNKENNATNETQNSETLAQVDPDLTQKEEPTHNDSSSEAIKQANDTKITQQQNTTSNTSHGGFSVYKAITSDDIVPNYNARLIKIKENSNIKTAWNDEIDLANELLSAVKKKQKELELKLAAEPNNQTFINQNKELAQLASATENHINQLVEFKNNGYENKTNPGEITGTEAPIDQYGTISLADLRSNYLGNNADAIFNEQSNNKDVLEKQQKLLIDYQSALKKKLDEVKDNEGDKLLLMNEIGTTQSVLAFINDKLSSGQLDTTQANNNNSNQTTDNTVNTNNKPIQNKATVSSSYLRAKYLGDEANSIFSEQTSDDKATLEKQKELLNNYLTALKQKQVETKDNSADQALIADEIQKTEALLSDINDKLANVNANQVANNTEKTNENKQNNNQTSKNKGTITLGDLRASILGDEANSIFSEPTSDDKITLEKQKELLNNYLTALKQKQVETKDNPADQTLIADEMQKTEALLSDINDKLANANANQVANNTEKTNDNKQNNNQTSKNKGTITLGDLRASVLGDEANSIFSEPTSNDKTTLENQKELLNNYLIALKQKQVETKDNPTDQTLIADEMQKTEALLSDINDKLANANANQVANNTEKTNENTSNNQTTKPNENLASNNVEKTNENKQNNNQTSKNKGTITLGDLRASILGDEANSIFSEPTSDDKITLEKQKELLNNYLTALKQKQVETKDNPADQALIADEIQKTEALLSDINDKLANVNANQVANNTEKTNDNKQNNNKETTSDDPKIQELQATVNELSAKEDELTHASTGSASGSTGSVLGKKEQKELEKQLADVQAQKTVAQTNLAVQNQASLAQKTAKQNNEINSSSSTSLQMSEIATNQLSNEVAKDVKDLQASKNKNPESLSTVLGKEDNLNQQLQAQNTAIEKEKITAELLDKAGATPTLLSSIDELTYENEQIDKQITDLNQQIKALEASKKKAKKKYRPSIEIDFQNMKANVIELQNMKKRNEDKINEIKQSQNVPQATILANNVQLPSDEKMREIAQQAGYSNIKNEINELNLLQNRLEKFNIESANTQTVIKNSIQQIASMPDADEKEQLKAATEKNIEKLQNEKEEINNLTTQIQTLNQKLEQNPALQNGDKNSIIAMALKGVSEENNATTSTKNTAQQTAATVGLNFNTRPVYSNQNLIPVDAPMPKGLVYKIQVGAFSKPIPAETIFKEFSPICAEKNPNFTRYVVGVFASKSTALTNQQKVRNLGYSDAFVVAYCDGERISLAQADKLIKSGTCIPNQELLAKSTEIENNQAIAINNATSNKNYELDNIDKNPSNNTAQNNVTENSSSGQNSNEQNTGEGISQSLFFTVQIGVYKTLVPDEQLHNVTPHYYLKTEDGYIRYSSGKFDNVASAEARKNEIRQQGIKDAYVTAYYQGKRITVNQALKLLKSKGNGILISNTNENTSGNQSSTSKEIVIQKKADDREKLDSNLIYQVVVSNENYPNYPAKELETWRTNNPIWAYYNVNTKRIESTQSVDIQNISDQTKIIYTYQGFEIDTNLGYYFTSLKTFDLQKTYYSLEVTWENEIPILLADWMQKNTYPLVTFDLNAHKIDFEPLSYEEKETLINILAKIKNLNFGNKK